MNAYSFIPTPFEALRLVVIRAGGQQKLADFLGASRVTIASWKRLPQKHVLEVEREFGVSRHWLRPDIYPEHSRPLRFLGVDQAACRVSFDPSPILKGKVA